MGMRLVATVLLAAGLLVPAAVAPAATDTTGASTPEDITSNPPETVTATAGGTSTSSVSSANADANDGNYTRLYVNDRYRHVELKPGESRSFEITVENGEDHDVELNPHLVLPQVGERPVEKSWVSIADTDTTLDAGAERTFNVTISVPDGTELGNYNGWIAFTNETVTYPGRPPRPVHAASFDVEVFKEPTVRILEGRYAYTQVQAGKNRTHTIVIENTGDQAVPVNPTIETQQYGYNYGENKQVRRSWLEIDAPTEIQPGETARVNITIAPPQGADRGDYDVEIDLGLKDPARPERSNHWQRIDLSFQIWKQPEEPFETTFEATENTTRVTLKLSAGGYRDGSTEPASFDVTFVSPNGTVIDAEQVRKKTRGYVDLSSGGDDDSPYQADGEHETFTYRLDAPDEGEWTVRITPKNTIQFGYEIIREES